MKGRRCNRIDVTLMIASVAGVVAIVLIAAVIGTDRWLVFTVDRTAIPAKEVVSADSTIASRYYHTRHRGMFRECYPGNDTAFLDTAKEVVDKNCFLLLFGDNPDGGTSDYSLMTGLYSGFLIMFLVGEFFLVIAYVIGLCLCIGKLNSTTWFAGLLSVVSAFCLVLGFALFHGSVYMERNEVKHQLRDRQKFYQQWTKTLQDATTLTYGESYIAGWVGFGLVIITSACYIMVAYFVPAPKKAPNEERSSRRGQHLLYRPQVSQNPLVYYVGK